MTYRLMTAAVKEPVALGEALDHLRGVDGEEHAYVADLIARARRWVERQKDRQLITATWELVLPCFPGEIEIRKLPVQLIASIKYYNSAGVLTTLAAGGYQSLIADPDEPGRIMPAYSKSWPTIRGGLYEAVVVNFKAGYGDDPEDVPEEYHHLILLLAGHMHEHRLPADAAPEVKELPLAIQSFLDAAEWGRYGG